ncbi:phage GP46 family protein [Methylobacterium indicum]|uniref:phage GP46 family protein n=1 Tax=Methylobacterium indicum TaxID=1775910 RepID=UPI0007345978|nr:phage GP46 family protein [Methylobacterium indicum]
MQITVTPLADTRVVVLPPDIVWLKADGTPAGPGESGVVGDFRLSTRAADGPVGGLVAANPLRTATLLLLFTDIRCESFELRPEHRGDRRGWPGDGFDIDTAAGEAPLGSKLWLYRRSILSEQVGMQVAAEAKRALSPLLRQQAVARIDTAYVLDIEGDALGLPIDMYGRDGRKVYADRFDFLWSRSDGGL